METMSETDRRTLSRRKAFLAVEIDASTRKKRGRVTRDASRRGLLIASPSRFAVGEALDLKVLVPHRGEVAVQARVTRVEENPVDSHEMWRWRFAVELDQDEPELFAAAG